MRNLFHNTIEASGMQLDAFKMDAGVQNSRVQEIFQLNSYRWLTTREVLAIYETKWKGITNDVTETLHGSIKRAICDLCDKYDEEGNLKSVGVLVKCSKEEMVMGPYGKKVFTWKLKEKTTV